MNSFQEQLAIGKLGESLIANWFKRRGFHIIPIYDIEIDEGKGPQVFTASGKNLIAPDLLVFNTNKIIWIEAKHKSAFTWHRRSEKWTTGIDMTHFLNYLKISEVSSWPVWLIFLQQNGVSKDMPSGKISPSGLYGENIRDLEDKVSHKFPGYGKGGMVYWAEEKLHRLADLSEVIGGNNHQIASQETSRDSNHDWRHPLKGEQLFLPGVFNSKG